MTPETPTDPNRHIHPWGAWTDEGTGPVILAVHGLPGSVRDFRYLGGAVRDRFRLIRVDMPGFGDVPQDYPPTPEGATEYLDRVVDKIGEPVFVLGHSFGSTRATAYAAARPQKVRGLALLAPFGIRPHAGYRALPDMQRIRLAKNVPSDFKAVEDEIRTVFESVGFRNFSDQDLHMTIESLTNFDFGVYTRQIKSLTCSTFAAWAKDDRMIEPEIVEELVPLLPDGPRLTFDEGGHNIQKFQAVEIADALDDWIISLGG